MLYSLKANANKFHLFLRPFIDKTISIEGFIIKSSKAKVFLVITIDSNLSFTDDVTYLCVTAKRKLYALSRVSRYIILEKRRIFMKSFIISQFSFGHLICMTCSRGLNNKINHAHERALHLS